MDNSSSAKWLTEMGIDEYNLMHQCHMNSLEEFTPQNMMSGFSFQQQSSFPNSTNFSNSSMENNSQTSLDHHQSRPTKLIKTNSWNSSSIIDASSSPKSSSQNSQFLSFENSKTNSNQFYGNIDCYVQPKDETVSSGSIWQLPASMVSQPVAPVGYDYSAKNNNHNQLNTNNKRPNNYNNTLTRTPSHAHDHILAERKRREKLSQRFIALSAIVPGLKKMDKASVLGDAIKYLKNLQERVKSLEEQTKKRTVESVVFIKKSQLSTDDESSSCDENFSDKALPEIEAKVSDKDVLIRVHCEKHKGSLVKILNEVEKLELSILNSSVLPFGSSTLDITIIARKEDTCNMSVKDLVKSLRVAFLEFM
ncbi:hypothetical protein ACFE04_000305 [Oxalis oulophora]